MKKTMLLIALFSFMYSHILPQNTTLDSLKNKLELQKNHDSVRVKTLWEYSDQLRYSDINDAIRYAKEAVEIAKELQWKQGYAHSLVNLSFMYSVSSSYDTAISYYLDA